MCIRVGEALMKLVADKLSVMRGSRAILTGVTFTVEAGSSLVLTGPNGAGKTTLIRAVAGLIPLPAGRILLEGGAPELTVGEQCHYVGHLNAVKSNLTVEENALFWAYFLEGNRKDISRALDQFGLSRLKDIPVA
jgi:heme exporter protein A